MARGVTRWSTWAADETLWWARVWVAPGQYVEVDKAEYERKRYQPPFWQVARVQQANADVSQVAMERIGSDFTLRIAPLGFQRTKPKLWARENEHTVESICFHFDGASWDYAPRTSSISIRVTLGIHVLSHPSRRATLSIMSDHIRKPDGSPYQNRFNSETWNAYDLCLADLNLLVAEFAEPWFAAWREPKALLDHTDLPARTRPLLEAALEGRSNPEHVAFALKACGIKESRFRRAHQAPNT